MLKQPPTVMRLEDHPNLPEILGVLARLAHVRDADLPRLAAAWTNDAAVAEARAKALSPDSPLVLEVLASFEAVGDLFEDDLRGEASYITVPPGVTSTALKAVRDAVAAAYARPVLTRTEHARLMRPWRRVFPVVASRSGAADEPDLGPQADGVKALLAALLGLATRCHDTTSQAVYDGLHDLSFVGEADRAGAREVSFEAAVLTGRRRIWALVCRSGAEGLGRPCSTCRRSGDGPQDARVLQLCLDAACALLVADAVPAELTRLLTGPVGRLIPAQRPRSC